MVHILFTMWTPTTQKFKWSNALVPWEPLIPIKSNWIYITELGKITFELQKKSLFLSQNQNAHEIPNKMLDIVWTTKILKLATNLILIIVLQWTEMMLLRSENIL